MTRKERTLLIRWSIFVTVLAAGFWTVWSLCGNTVPSSDACLPWPLQAWRPPFHVSRWWDVTLAAPLVVTVWKMAEWTGVCDAKFGKLGDSVCVAILIGSGGALLAGLFAGIYANTADTQQTGIFLTIVLIASGTLTAILAAVHGNRWFAPVTPIIPITVFLLTSSVFAGFLHAFLWSLQVVIVMGAAFSFGRIVRLAGPALTALKRWLSGHGLTDDAPVAAAKPEPPLAPLQRPAPTDPLQEYDRLADLHASTQTRLEALRKDPDTAKLLALRAERPAA